MAVWVVPFFLPFWSEVAQSCVTLYNPMDYIAYQAPPSMEFSRQEYCSGLPFPSPGDLPDPGIEFVSSELQVNSLPLSYQGSHICIVLGMYDLTLFFAFLMATLWNRVIDEKTEPEEGWDLLRDFSVVFFRCCCFSCQVVPGSFITPWTVAHRAPLSMRFPWQDYWSGLPFPSPRDFPTQGSNPGLPDCRQML